MIDRPIYFELQELVCPDVFKQYKERAWAFFDARLLITIDRLRLKLGKPIFVNSWNEQGVLSQRGFRCIKCDIVKTAFAENRLYVSAHMTGQAIDFDVQGLVASEVREYIIKNKNLWPYPIRLEDKVSWVHCDTRDSFTDEKVILF